MIKFFVDLFSKTESQKIKEAEFEAAKRFNIVHIDGYPYLTYCGVVISKSDDIDVLVRLNELRTRFVNDYLKNEGRI